MDPQLLTFCDLILSIDFHGMSWGDCYLAAGYEADNPVMAEAAANWISQPDEVQNYFYIVLDRYLKPTGVKLKFYDLKHIEDLANVGCTTEEMAGILGTSARTIKRRRTDQPGFQAALDRGKANMKQSLRRKQITVANTGNAQMLIWLGKNHLDQKDKQEITGDENAPVVVTNITRTVIDMPSDTEDGAE